ncbi:MLP-like protein 43 [Malania oleifera]|uniref:MLP-like protein 43 n=1 Tax=Malania oleifera TaxID=397392 RepID=UPI0025ADF7F6|nr:MLP-like protein 43 [Malania oleifera]
MRPQDYPASTIYCVWLNAVSSPSSLWSILYLRNIGRRSMGGLAEKLEVEAEIKSPADKFYNIFRRQMHHLPNCSARVHNINLHQGGWETEGSIKQWTYVADGKVETAKEKVVVDEKNRMVTLVVVEGDPLKYYKAYSVILKVIPKGEGGIAKWTLEYEKLNEDAPDPHAYLDLALNITRDLDASLLTA